jgi:hypothetical protein
MELNSFKQFLYLKEIAKNKFARFREKEGISQEEIDRAHADFEKLQALRKIPQTFNIQAKDFEGKPLTFKVLRDLLDAKLKEIEEKVKSKKDEYDLIENTLEYLVIEPHHNYCAFEWAPKASTGESVWCIGWGVKTERDNWFQKYKDQYGARYFLIIDKKENPNEAKYAFAPMPKRLDYCQYRDYTNDYNVKSAIRNQIFAKLPLTEAVIKNHLGEFALTLNYDRFEEIDRPEGSYPVRYKVGIDQNTDLSNPRPSDKMNYGVLDDKGKIVLPVKYSGIGTDEGFFIVKVYNDDEYNKKALASWNGIFITPPDTYYSDIYVHSNKVIVLVDANEDRTLYGVINSQGETILPIEYSRIEYDDGILYVKTRDGMRKIFNSKGQEITKNDKYSGIDSFYTAGNYTIARAKVESKYVIIDDEGNELITEDNNYVRIGTFYHLNPNREPQAIVGVNHPTSGITFYGVINLKNEVIVPIKYNDVEFNTSENSYEVLVSQPKYDLTGIYTYEGELILPPLYNYFRDIRELENSFRVYNVDSNTNNRKWGVFKDGGELIPPNYSSLEYVPETKEFKVSLEDLFGIIDLNGKEVLPCEYSNIDIFDDEHLVLYMTTNLGNFMCALYHRAAKKLLTKFKYVSIWPFDKKGMARVSIGDDKDFGYINKQGQEVIPCIYRSISDFEDLDITKATKTDEKIHRYLAGVIDRTGKEIIPFIYSWMGTVYDDPDSLIKVKNLEDKLGFINQQGQEVIPCKYDTLASFDDSTDPNEWASMAIGDRYGKVNIKGEEKWDNEA